MSRPVEHLFTVDVEEYFQVLAFEDIAPRAKWDSYPSRVAYGVDVLLDLLARHRAYGTFFVLGWVAERRPDVVRRIAAAGHDVASHGWWHQRVSSLTPDEFRREVRESKAILEALSGRPCIGFRAPSFSITRGVEWALDVLVEEGYEYDSSLFPIVRPGYGYPDAPPVPHYLTRSSGVLAQFPPTTTELAGMRLPAAGGGYFRHFPYAFTRRAFREYEQGGVPGVFYIHPWEVDPGQPQMDVSWLTRQRHYGGIPQTVGRLEQLLTEFRFTSIERKLEECEGESESQNSQASALLA